MSDDIFLQVLESNSIDLTVISEDKIQLTINPEESIQLVIKEGPAGLNAVTDETACTISGILKGDGSHVAAAIPDVDFLTSVYTDEHYQQLIEKGEPNGYVPLNSSGIIDAQYLPTAAAGALTYIGTYDASSGIFPLNPEKGFYWVISVQGVISSVTYRVNDWLTYNGSSWNKVDNYQLITSVNNQTGIVTVNAISQLTGDVTAGPASSSESKAATVVSVGGSTASAIHSAELLANAATNLSTPNAIVKRDSLGNFSAGTITASLNGNSTSANSATNFTGSLSGDVTGTQSATVVSKVNSSTLPPSALIIGTNSSRQIIDASSVTLSNNTTGTASNLSGTPLLPNGTTVTTQSQGNNSTRIASTAYVDTGLSTKQNTLGFTPENVSNKSTDILLGTSNIFYPSQNAVKTYVDLGLSTKQNSGNYITALTGDVTANGPGSSLSTVTKVNSGSIPISKNIVGTNSSGQLIDASSATLSNNTTGTASNLSGTPQLPNGTTATTQSSGDNSSKIATTAYVDQINNSYLPIATFNEYNLIQKEPTGFSDASQTVISFNDSLREFSISPTSTSFDVFIKGTKITISTAKTSIISNLTGLYYFYFDSLGNLNVTNTFTSSLILDYAIIAIIYWNQDTGSRIYFANERHGCVMDGMTHAYLHTVFGARFISGGALQNFSVDGTGNINANAQFTSDGGSIRDEDLLISFIAQSQIPILYRQGTAWRKKSGDSFPVIYSGTAGYTGANGLLAYNLLSGGTWSLAEVTNNQYVLVHIYATNDIDNPVVGAQGLNIYNSISTARTGAINEIHSFDGLPFAEFVALGSVIFQTSTGYTNTPKARVRSTDTGSSYVDFRGTQTYTPSGSVIQSHSLLANLSNDDHLQYLTEARGDARYINSISGDVTGTGFPSVTTTVSKINNGSLPTSKNIVGTNSSGQIIDTSSATLSNNTTGTASNLSGTPALPNGTTATTQSQADNSSKIATTNYVDTGLATKQNSGSYITSLTGDVTASGPGVSNATIANTSVTNSKLELMPAGTIKGNNTLASGSPLDLTATQATAMLNAFIGDSGSGGAKGLVPAPSSGDAIAGKVLKSDGSWGLPVSATSPITFSSGTIAISAASTLSAGSMSAGDKSKLDGIQAGATANSPDSYLLNRANHTGTQSVSTITGLAAIATTGSYIDLSSTPLNSSGTFSTGIKPAILTLTGSGTVSTSVISNFNTVIMDLIGNVTLGSFSTASDGQKIIIRVRQDAVGGRTLSINTTYWNLGTDISSMTINYTAYKYTYVGAIYNSGTFKWDIVSIVRGY